MAPCKALTAASAWSASWAYHTLQRSDSKIPNGFNQGHLSTRPPSFPTAALKIAQSQARVFQPKVSSTTKPNFSSPISPEPPVSLPSHRLPLPRHHIRGLLNHQRMVAQGLVGALRRARPRLRLPPRRLLRVWIRGNPFLQFVTAGIKPGCSRVYF